MWVTRQKVRPHWRTVRHPFLEFAKPIFATAIEPRIEVVVDDFIQIGLFVREAFDPAESVTLSESIGVSGCGFGQLRDQAPVRDCLGQPLLHRRLGPGDECELRSAHLG